MQAFYNFLLNIVQFSLPFPAKFNKKLKLFVEGRKEVFTKLRSQLNPHADYIWFHTASLGEFEQAVPVMEKIKIDFPHFKILVTFFSPSGYENKKEHPLAEVITYLPLDTPGNAKKFINLVQPKIAFFVKYEIWPNYLKELQHHKIPVFLFSGAFRKNQIYFKAYGGWMRKSLKRFNYFFLQNSTSLQLLKSVGLENAMVSGDTRFDRVARQIEYNNKLNFAEEFVGNKLCIVAGSTWPEDHKLLIDFLNASRKDFKFIMAPHEINTYEIDQFRQKLVKKSILYSKRHEENLSNFDILIIDHIGLLNKLYSYANIAYVGGAAGKTGLHNILEPATFGVPIVIGKNFKKFPEAKNLQKLAGLFSVKNTKQLKAIFDKLLENAEFRRQSGAICSHFINSNTGATRKLLRKITEQLH